MIDLICTVSAQSLSYKVFMPMGFKTPGKNLNKYNVYQTLSSIWKNNNPTYNEFW
jgi:hypothetical protein